MASKDANYVNVLTAVLNTDGQTVMSVYANPITHRLMLNNGTTGSDNGPTNAIKDKNHVPTLLGTSSGDGLTPVTAYADSGGKLLIRTI